MAAFNYIIELNIIFSLLLGIHYFILRKQTDFQFNRVYLLAIALFSLIVPLVKIPVFGQINLLRFPLLTDVQSNSNTTNVATEFNMLHLQELIVIMYAFICLICFVILVIKLIKINKEVKVMRSKAKFDNENDIFVLNAVISPFTFLKWSFIPEALMHQKEVALIIAHEKSHAKGLHSVDIIIAEFLSCILFINPLHRLYKKCVADNHEYLADAAALQHNDASVYTRLLVKHTLYPSHISMASFFAKPTILNRITMMKTENNSFRTKYAATIIALLLVSIMACEMQEEEEIVIIENNENVQVNNVDDLNSDKIFTIVEDQAVPVGGIQGFYYFIAQELSDQYPKQAQALGVEGVVYVQFTIEKDGSLSNITAVKGIGAGCDLAAVNAVAHYGKWIPGKQAGVIVRSQRIVPIRFVLN